MAEQRRWWRKSVGGPGWAHLGDPSGRWHEMREGYVDEVLAALTGRDRLVQAEVITEAFASRLALKSHDDGATYHVVWAGDYDSIYNEALRKLVENFLQARLALDAMQEKA